MIALIISGCNEVEVPKDRDSKSLSESIPGRYVHIYCDKDHHNLVYVRDNVGLAVVSNGC